MGQAKNRKAEIDALKTNPKVNPLLKDTTLTALGAHYKSDDDYGWSITVTDKLFGPNGLSGNLTQFNSLIETMVSGYKQHIGIEPVWPNEVVMAEDLLKQTEALVRFINTELYGSEIQPNAGLTKNNNIAPILEEIIIFMANVLWLTRNGYLTNDNYNGMYYCYRSYN